jgi:hypothetical protein
MPVGSGDLGSVRRIAGAGPHAGYETDLFYVIALRRLGQACINGPGDPIDIYLR